MRLSTLVFLFATPAIGAEAIALPAVPSMPGDLYVDGDEPCTGADGSAAAPFCSITSAIDVALDGDTIHVAAGVYREVLSIDKELVIRGDQAGPQRAVLRAPDTVPSPYNIVHVLADGRATFEDVDFTGTRIINTRVSRIFGIEGTAVVRDALIDDNRVEENVIEVVGGAAAFDMERCKVTSNIISSYGGIAMSYDASRFALKDVVIEGHTNGATALIGVRVTTTDEAVIDGLSMSANDLGVASIGNPSFVIKNSTIAFNRYNGLQIEGGNNLVDHCTIAHNTLLGGATASAITAGAIAPVRVRSSVLGGGGALAYPSVAGLTGLSSFLSLGGNVVTDAGNVTDFVDGVLGDQVGTSTAVLDARLGALQLNRGFGKTMVPEADSPAIDRGVPGGGSLAMDQNGNPRIAGSIEVGAVEREISNSVASCLTVDNSSGRPAVTLATGSNLRSQNAVMLSMVDLPPGNTGFFLASETPGFMPGAGGSDGNLCLAGDVGRFVGPGQVMASNEYGRINLRLNLAAMPQPTGAVNVIAGQTWHLQGWFRDSVAGAATSNFSTSASILFQ